MRDALNSVLAQTWPHHEVIVVNDGATDSSAAILNEYKDHIHIITQKNAGIAAARNTGIAAAKGAFIALIDQDDMWDKQKLERQMAFFEAHPDAHILITHLRHMLQDGMERPFWLKPELLENDLPGYLPSTMLVRRGMYEIIGPYNSEYTLTDDGKWLFDAKDRGYAIHVLPETLVTRRIHGENNSGNVEKLQSELLKIVRGSIAKKRIA